MSLQNATPLHTIWTVYTTQTCGDGCCSWGETTIESSDGRIDSFFEKSMFSTEEEFKNFLDEWLNYTVPAWQVSYTIDASKCTYY